MSGLRLKAGVVEAELLAVLRDRHGLMGSSYQSLLGLLETAVGRRQDALPGHGLEAVTQAVCTEGGITQYELGVTDLQSLRSDAVIDDDDKLTSKGSAVLLEMARVMEYVHRP